MSTPPIDYTARDFIAVRRELKNHLRSIVPDWIDNDASFEMVLLDAFAYVGDILNYYIDRAAAETFLATAVRRDSILRIAQMFGYVPTPQVAAVGTVRFTKNAALPSVAVPAGTQVFSQQEGAQPVIFETVADAVITDPFLDIEVREGATVSNELLGTSTGLADQTFSIFRSGVIKDSVRVFTQDGDIDPATGDPTLVEWRYSERLIDGNFQDRVFTVWMDSNGFSYVVFGDGVNGQIPSVNAPVYCTYRYGYGSLGNVAAGAIKSLVSGGVLAGRISSVSNLSAMQGGADAETMEGMRRAIPQSLVAVERAVTTADYQALALRVGGIAKAKCVASNAVNVLLYVAPVGGGSPSVQLQNQVKAYLDERKMLGVSITTGGPTYVPVNVSVSVETSSQYRNTDIQASVRAAIDSLYSFDNVGFGHRVNRAELFKTLVSVPGVTYVNVTAFNRDGAGFDPDFTLAHNEIPIVGSVSITVTGGIEAL